MSAQTVTSQRGSLASPQILDAYTDSVLSRQAMQCSPATLAFYRYTAGVFVDKVQSRGPCSPNEITGRHVRDHLAAKMRKIGHDWPAFRRLFWRAPPWLCVSDRRSKKGMFV